MGMKILSMVSILATASNTVKSCTLSESGPSPYLIRIYESGTDPITHGHGSLIRHDKVLSTCTPFRRLPKKLKNTNWRLTGYNFDEQCTQQREPKEIVMHESCYSIPLSSSNDPITHDLAIWKVEPFETVGLPFLWGNGKTKPPPLTIVKSIVDSLLEFQTALLVTTLFKEGTKDEPELQHGTGIDFINWFVCLDMLQNFTNVTGDMVNGLNPNTSTIQGFYDYFCGYDEGIKWDDSLDGSNPVNADWYSGAAVMYQLASGMKIPIGLFSRGVKVRPVKYNLDQNTKNFHVVMGFHESVYEFLSNNGIEPSALESDFRSEFPATVNWRRGGSSGPELGKYRNQNNHSNQSCLSARGLWIHLLAFVGCIIFTKI